MSNQAKTSPHTNWGVGHLADAALDALASLLVYQALEALPDPPNPPPGTVFVGASGELLTVPAPIESTIGATNGALFAHFFE